VEDFDVLYNAVSFCVSILIVPCCFHGGFMGFFKVWFSGLLANFLSIVALVVSCVCCAVLRVPAGLSGNLDKSGNSKTVGKRYGESRRSAEKQGC